MVKQDEIEKSEIDENLATKPKEKPLFITSKEKALFKKTILKKCGN